MEKKAKRRIAWVISIIAIISLMVGLLLTSIEWVAFDLDYYDKEFDKLNISGATGMNQTDLLNTIDELLDYVKDEREDLNIPATVHGQERMVFNDREIAHMVDVKELFLIGFRLRWIAYGVFAFLIIILIIMRSKDLLKSLSISFLIILGILTGLSLVLVLFILTDFTWLWNKLHHIFFSNDLWLLDPETDILIQMVPEQFFFNIIVKILSLFGAGLGILGISSSIVLLKKGSKKQKRMKR